MIVERVPVALVSVSSTRLVAPDSEEGFKLPTKEKLRFHVPPQSIYPSFQQKGLGNAVNIAFLRAFPPGRKKKA
jgi:hypothetical protein